MREFSAFFLSRSLFRRKISLPCFCGKKGKTFSEKSNRKVMDLIFIDFSIFVAIKIRSLGLGWKIPFGAFVYVYFHASHSIVGRRA